MTQCETVDNKAVEEWLHRCDATDLNTPAADDDNASVTSNDSTFTVVGFNVTKKTIKVDKVDAVSFIGDPDHLIEISSRDHKLTIINPACLRRIELTELPGVRHYQALHPYTMEQRNILSRCGIEVSTKGEALEAACREFLMNQLVHLAFGNYEHRNFSDNTIPPGRIGNTTVLINKTVVDIMKYVTTTNDVKEWQTLTLMDDHAKTHRLLLKIIRNIGVPEVNSLHSDALAAMGYYVFVPFLRKL